MGKLSSLYLSDGHYSCVNMLHLALSIWEYSFEITQIPIIFLSAEDKRDPVTQFKFCLNVLSLGTQLLNFLRENY
jgi:hypothetical protein